MSSERFDEVILPHLDAAHRLARWRRRHEDDARSALDHEMKKSGTPMRTRLREQQNVTEVM
jgi:hypothetical protein